MIDNKKLRIQPVIGLEIHIQLDTQTKLFCGCPAEFAATPNTRTCPVCLGLPGALPVINMRAVELAVRAAIALKANVATTTRWDRKNYFYPDLPKNYQITQFNQPLATGGVIEFPIDNRPRRIPIRRIHLEEDAGKSAHDLPKASGIDFNRAGIPLLEIVTEPDLHSPAEVREFAVQLQRIAKYLGISQANMQRAQMRFEPNVNVHINHDRHTYQTPVTEIKNLNSFRALHDAVEYEIQRQIRNWHQDHQTATPANKSNRGWDDQQQITVPQRHKEHAADYRYLPDPDLVPLTLQRNWLTALRHDLPELPLPRALRVASEYQLQPPQADALVSDCATADLLDDAAAFAHDKNLLAKQLLSFWSHLANTRDTSIANLRISPGRLAQLANLTHEGRISPTAAAHIAEQMLNSHASPDTLAGQLGLLQSQDATQLADWVAQAIRENPDAVRDARQNPKKAAAARNFLCGQVMRISKGRANPKQARDLIGQQLDAQDPQ